ncbi:MAG TPA: MdtA/MuxA family multidrug efflux RND transporter periplasmic adaptor subunit [Acetobacteraceae bacterium]|nr:MdtA/MuxA family multidrug efflux RND transporter periplasmic adaptor subunit [Acetobacteraceae bacterium]
MDERVDRPEAGFQRAPQSRGPAPRRSRLRWVLGLVIVLVAGLAAAWLWSTHHAVRTAGHGGPGGASQTPPQPVGAATIGKGDIRIILNALGTVTSLDTVTVVTQINGQLTEVGFKEGQIVKKGDFLAQIDPRPYQVALEQARGTLARDKGLLAQAQADLKRYQTLGRQDSIAQQQLQDQHYLVEQYTGTVQTDQGTVDGAKLNLAYCRIVSPIDGQVGLRQVDPGNYVQTGSATGIAVITRMQPISVLFSVPQEDVPAIIQRMRAGATLSVAAYDQANVKLLATGRLATLDNLIDTTTGTLRLRATFANPDEMLYPNQFVNARLLVNTLKNVVRVPVPAVQRGAPGTYVYVINANDTVSVRPVKLGPTDGGYEAVLSGLQPGEKVVTDGTDRLRDGVKVTVPAPAQAQSPGQGSAQPGQAAQPGQKTQPGQQPHGQPHPPPGQ